jgi:hypothetical protein
MLVVEESSRDPEADAAVIAYALRRQIGYRSLAWSGVALACGIVSMWLATR